MNIPEGFIAKNWTMDPETEDLIPGSKLRNGLFVLIEDTTWGGRLDAEAFADEETRNPYEYQRLMTTQRWCEVSDLQRLSHEIIKFIGIYPDGTKISRTYNLSWCWYVKKDQAVIPYNIVNDKVKLAQMIAAHTSGLQFAHPEQADFDIAGEAIKVIETLINN